MSDDLSPAERAKKAAAARAIGFVRPGMKLGLGTGSTAAWLVKLLGAQKFGGECVPTSSRTAALAAECGLRLTTLDEAGRLDLVIDGADEFDPEMRLIKGGGGALLQEKIVATAADRMVVISDPSKEVATLGAFPLPVEVIRFGWKTTRGLIAERLAGLDVGGRVITPRMEGDQLYLTDEGHYILDLHLARIGDPEALAEALLHIPGVVETGLFLGVASAVVIGEEDGSARVIER